MWIGRQEGVKVRGSAQPKGKRRPTTSAAAPRTLAVIHPAPQVALPIISTQQHGPAPKAGCSQPCSKVLIIHLAGKRQRAGTGRESSSPALRPALHCTALHSAASGPADSAARARADHTRLSARAAFLERPPRLRARPPSAFGRGLLLLAVRCP